MSAIQKYSEGFKKFEFCDDFGDKPIGFGNVTDDQGTIAIVGLVTGFVAVAGLGLPGLALTAFFFVNDFIWAGRDEDDDSAEPRPVVINDPSAIDVAASPSMQQTQKLNPVPILAASICHRGFWGGQRTGKSLLASVASKAMAERHGVEVWYINLYAADRAETLAMYAHADRVLIADLAGDCHNPELIIEQLGDMISAFKKKSSILLIIDELPTMASTLGEYSEALSAPLKALCGHVTDLGQSAMKRKKAVWSIGAGIVAVNLTNEGKAMLKGSKPVLVSVVADRGVTWNGQAVLPDPNIIGQLKANFPGVDFTVPAMDCDRVVQVDGQWIQMPKLEVPAAVASDPYGMGGNDAPRTSRTSEEIKGMTELIGLSDQEKLERVWEASTAIEVEAVEVQQSHPLKDKFDRLESLMDGKDSLPIREIQRAFSCKSDEAQQIAQMFCMSQKSSYRFTQSTKANGTVSKSIERV
jgi:hypothetical protein